MLRTAEGPAAFVRKYAALRLAPAKTTLVARAALGTVTECLMCRVKPHREKVSRDTAGAGQTTSGKAFSLQVLWPWIH